MEESQVENSVESQTNYQETEYADNSWEVIGEMSDEFVFIPLEVDVLEGELVATDPMFANYGGLPEQESVTRWHLPKDAAVPTKGLTAAEEEEEEDLRIKLTEEELEEVKKKAFNNGKDKGLELAGIENNEKLKVLEERYVTLANDLQQQLRERISQTELRAVELAVAISKKILDTTVDINPEYISQIVSEALELTGSAVVKKIRVSPQDLEFIEVVGLESRVGGDEAWEWEADPSIKSGCVVETTAGEIDYQLDHAWERVREKVIKLVR